jgi:hypothetical protein
MWAYFVSFGVNGVARHAFLENLFAFGNIAIGLGGSRPH